MSRICVSGLGALLAAFTLSACSGGGGGGGGGGGSTSTTFAFEMLPERNFAITVTDDSTGNPIEGAIITVTNQLTNPGSDLEGLESEIDGEVYFQGATDASGQASAVVRIPTDRARVDVVVQVPDYTGPWTVDTLQEAWGDFAPSARVTRSVGSLGAVAVALTPES